jgi:hypothetical protein
MKIKRIGDAAREYSGTSCVTCLAPGTLRAVCM